MDSGNPDLSPTARLKGCEDVLEYTFHDQVLLRRALTHASVATTRLESNERLEFLGDAVLGMVVCETLFELFPEYPEGELTRIKSSLVSRTTCARISREYGLDRFLFLGKGLIQRRSLPMSILAAVFESLIAAVYIDGGIDVAADLIRRLLKDELEAATEQHHGKNFKSVLQQLSQKSFGDTPCYQLLDEKGPDHSKCFKVAAVIGRRAYASAWGASKKEAEQRAAHNALSEIQGNPLPYVSD